ncbi:hepatic sodium/bile acid cotransporter-like [Watersipora subatra]|uniref:hepatic sodium/bile acid cotransporter-like n=1 Tax=Watersipora subatra TaxID=2589382 RepID=UPI00355BB390
MLFSSVFFVFFIRFISCLPDHAEGNSTQFKILLPSPDDRFVTIFYRYGKVPEVSYSVLLYTDKPLNNLSVSAESRQPSIVTVSEQVTISSCQENTTWNVTMNNRATLPASYNADNLLSAEICQNLSFYSTSVYLGYSVIRFYASFDESDGLQYIGNITMRSMREHRLIDKVFNAVVMAAVVVATLGMGNDLDFQTIKEHLKTPKAPVIAMISQFTVMPLTSYAIIRIMGHTGARALGFFVLGCSPAGINSNMFSKLLNGDLSLSVTMTTLSTAISLGMLPLWVYTLGSTIPADEGLEKVKIPFIGNVKSFSLIIGTLAVGVFIKYKLPKVSKILRRILKASMHE